MENENCPNCGAEMNNAENRLCEECLSDQAEMTIDVIGEVDSATGKITYN